MEERSMERVRTRLAAAAMSLVALSSAPAAADDTAGRDDAALRRGRLVWAEANCAGCHKWHGAGGGGYGGAALSLRATALAGEALAEVVACGRPGTRMPAHLQGAWDTRPCYALRRSDLDVSLLPPAGKPLDADDVAAVVVYVETAIRGRGEPDHDECLAYWGSAKRQVCEPFRTSR